MEIDRPKQLKNTHLIPTPNEVLQSMIDGVFLRFEATHTLGGFEQAIINLEVSRHIHTLFHTFNVSRLTHDSHACFRPLT